MPKPDLDAAYGLVTPEDSRKLYADWADTYDETFAAAQDYLMPSVVAEALRARCTAPARVLDVGAGTGLVGQALSGAGFEVDGLDISADMLRVAGQKRVYAQLFEADLTQTLTLPADTYDTVISAGTFTHGHVGPDALDGLLEVAAPGAWFVLGVNAEHFEARGFAAKFDALAGRIIDLQFELQDIYGPGADPAHAQDQLKLTTFRKR